MVAHTTSEINGMLEFTHSKFDRDQLLSLARQRMTSYLSPLFDRLSCKVDPRLMRSFREAFLAILVGYDANASLLLTRFAEVAVPNCDNQDPSEGLEKRKVTRGYPSPHLE